MLGTVKSLSPSTIVHQEEGEDSPEFITNLLKMATIFNKYLKNIVTTLRQDSDRSNNRTSLKLAAPLIEDSLQHLVKLSIESQNFATPWKLQLILPFHNKKEKTKVENYRPVSHLVEVGKLTEYIIGEQILANHSKATVLIQLTDIWMQASEKKKLTGVCMIDQSAAYDLLSHSHFTGRSQCVQV